MTRVLALDLSSRVGFAVDAIGGAADAPPVTGVWRLPGLDAEIVGASYAKLVPLIDAAIVAHDVDLVAFEAPLPPSTSGGGAPKAAWVAMAQQGLAAVTEMAALLMPGEDDRGQPYWVRRPGVEVVQVHVQTVRKHFVGSGRPENPKAAVKARCRQLGWPVIDDNSADACAVWAFVKAMRAGLRLSTAAPLFGRSA
jgi:hypothetical protein